MLFGDAHIEESAREFFLEWGEPGGSGHGCGDGYDVVSAAGHGKEFFAEHAGPVGFFHLEWQTGFGVDLPSGVHELRHVVFGRCVAAAFFRHHVDEQGAVVVAGVCHGGVEGFLVVSVDWAHIFEPQVGEHFGGDDAGFHAFFKGVERFECALPHPAEGFQGGFALLHDLVVAVVDAEVGEVFSQATNGGRVAAAIVVDDDDDFTVVAGSNVIECFPAHAAGEGPVADDGDDGAVGLAGELEGFGQAISVAERRGGVG